MTNTGEARDVGSIPGSGRFPGGWHDKPLQYSCLENPKDRGAWQVGVHRVTKSQTQLKWLSMNKNIFFFYSNFIKILLHIFFCNFYFLFHSYNTHLINFGNLRDNKQSFFFFNLANIYWVCTSFNDNTDDDDQGITHIMIVLKYLKLKNIYIWILILRMHILKGKGDKNDEDSILRETSL